jgi:HlyD family secretion protein
MTAVTRTMKRNFWPILIAILLVAGGGAYAVWQQPASLLKGSAAQAQQTPTYQTSPVRRGDLSIAISGTGNLTAANSADVSFPAQGNVSEIMVKVGDAVTAGQTLAALGNQEQLQVEVENAQLAVQAAMQTLNQYTASPDGNIAQASLTLATAEKAQATAQQNVRNKGQPRCEPGKTEDYYYAYLTAQNKVNDWEGQLNNPKSGYGKDYVLKILNPLRRARDLAYANYTYCQVFTDQEITASHANLQVAQANLQSAQAAYDSVKKNNGLDPATVSLDQAAVKKAEGDLTKAQNNLAGATLVSPISGTVTAINGSVGQPSGTSTFVTIADLNDPLIQVNIDETDLPSFKAGCPAQVTFSSIPAKVFPGTVSQVLPVLSSKNNVSSAQGYVALQNVTKQAGKVMPLGSSASVTVTCNQASNVLEIPVSAVHQTSGQPAFVYVLNLLGQPEKREVSLGIRTSVLVEVKSGLSEGERVITSPVNLK